jgi:uncharacterized protein
MDEKYRQLQDVLKQYEQILVAFSGGLDSGFLLYAAVDTLGPENVTAVIGDSPSLASGEKDEAVAFAKMIGLTNNHVHIITTTEIDNPDYAANDLQRCFHCKTELYGRLRQFAAERGITTVADGYNASDKADFRPGHRAAADFQVISPLAEAGLEKEIIRLLARQFNLKIADKPSSACLASRIPFGTPVTKENLAKVDRAETALKKLGLRGMRVRFHGEVARIELPQEDIPRLTQGSLKDNVIRVVKEAGFRFVTLDLEGYRTGSFNPDPDKLKEGTR